MNMQNKPGIHAVAYISWMLHISISPSLQNPFTTPGLEYKGSSLSPPSFTCTHTLSHTHTHTHAHTHHRLVVGPGGLLLGSQGASLVWWRHFVWSRGRLQQTPEEMPISYWLCYGLEESGREREREGEKERGGTTIQDAEWKNCRHQRRNKKS